MEANDLLDNFSSYISRLRENFSLSHFVIGFSGGIDSTVLVDLSVNYFVCGEGSFSIVHIDHDLHAASGSWARHCAAVASSMGQDCKIVKLDSSKPKPDGLEAWARSSRYQALSELVSPGVCVLTAHHSGDQVETILQHTLQGAGPYGLAGIPSIRPFSSGYLARPLLESSPFTINKYARLRNLKWVEDPSNSDEKFLRNNIRHTALPMLNSIVPDADQGLLRIGKIQSELLDGLNDIIDEKLAHCELPIYQVDLRVFEKLPQSLYPYVVKRVVARLNMDILGRRHINEILKLCNAGYSASPVVCWADSEVRLFRSRLYFMRKIPQCSNSGFKLDKVPGIFNLPGGQLKIDASMGTGLSQEKVIDAVCRVIFRKGGEMCRLNGRLHRHKLKKLFQSWGIPPWERGFMPILSTNDEIIAVGGHYINPDYVAAGEELGFTIQWRSNLYTVRSS